MGAWLLRRQPLQGGGGGSGNLEALFSSLRLRASACAFQSARRESSSSTDGREFTAEYLVSVCGLSSNEAAKAFDSLSHLKSAVKVESSVAFLKEAGFSDAEIASAVCSFPRVLCAKVEKTLRPKFQYLKTAGFSPSQIAAFLSFHGAFYQRDLPGRLNIFLPMLGSVDRLLKTLKRNSYLFNSSIDRVIAPNLALLQQCGLSTHHISKVLLSTPRLITMKPEKVEGVIRRAEELGIPRGSGMFPQAIIAACSSVSKMRSRFLFLRKLGWSEADVACAIAMKPTLLQYSESNIQSKVEFLTKEIGLQISGLAHMPWVLTLSLDRRLVPRHRVLQILKSKGVRLKCCKFNTLSCWRHELFIKRFILPYEEIAPGLGDAYRAACSGQVSALTPLSLSLET